MLMNIILICCISNLFCCKKFFMETFLSVISCYLLFLNEIWNIDCGNDNINIEPIAIADASFKAATPCSKQYKRSLLNIPDIAL